MQNRDIREAQQVMLLLLREFDIICKRHKFCYWIDHGTLLGAVRHQGFIPWDDDLDVTMPREDYEKFLRIAEKELPETIFLQTKKSDPSMHVHHAKLRDRKSTYIEDWEEGKNICFHQGIFMDIFPVNYISPSEAGEYRSIVNISKIFCNRYIKIDIIANRFINRLNSFHSADNTFIVSGGENMHYVTHVSKEVVFPLQVLEFEGMNIPVPNNTHAYLVSIFGEDYMTLPSKEKQKVHSIYICTQEQCSYEKRKNG